MKWLSIAAVALALLIGCAYLMVNKQEDVIRLTEAVQAYMGRREALQKEVSELESRWDEFASMRMAGHLPRICRRQDRLGRSRYARPRAWFYGRRPASDHELAVGDELGSDSKCWARSKK